MGRSDRLLAVEINVVLASYGLTNPIKEFLGTLLHNFSPTFDLERRFKYIPK